MADTIKFQCDLDTTNPSIPLRFEVLLDGKNMFKTEHVVGPYQVAFDLIDDDANHQIQFVMTGKTQEHTKIDDNGNITSDTLLKISNVQVDDIILDQFLYNLVEYVHDFNSTQTAITGKFYGNMGCNGTVTFEFTTPFYLWLLENM